MKNGFIYILSNKSLKEGLLKIGKTTLSTTKRSKQLSASTSIPENFQIEDEFEFADIDWAEKKIHNTLNEFRFNEKREFFNCEINVARQCILKLQVADKQKQINKLKIELHDSNKIVIGSEFVKYKWSKFFDKLNWDYQSIQSSFDFEQPDFIINGKSWDTGDGEYLINTDKIAIYILPNLKLRINNNSELNSIVEVANPDYRLIVISTSPLDKHPELIFGWEYNRVSNNWEEKKMIKHKNYIGVFDEDRSWFCFIHGNFLEKQDLWPDTKEILDLWRK